ncbi:MAG TPA: hypothetical protein VLM85_09475 [Polyangiaceae bacterium]|nr:hypothetical protein [Polyangiaceae bacterium]
MLLVLFFAVLLAAAYAASQRIWSWRVAADAPGAFEHAASIGVLAFAIALAIDWGLALAHVFTPAALVVASIALAGASARSLARLRGALSSEIRSGDPLLLVGVAIAPLAIWVGYVLWRDSVLAVFGNDGLAYHMPKALLIARTHRYAVFDGPDLRIGTFPANYEMLVADTLSLTGGDRAAGSVGVASYVLVGAVAGAMAERWWKGPRKLHVIATALLTLAMPTLLVGSGAYKNDVMLAAALLAACVWIAGWAVHGSRPRLFFALVAAAIAIGTKPTGGVLVPIFVAAVVARARRGGRARASEITVWVAGAIAGGVLLGGAAYLVNIAATGKPIGVVPGNGYGDWKNLWMFPALVFERPFVPRAAVWVFWKHEWWFWPEYDVYFSTYGVPASLALFALPFAVVRYRRHGAASERAFASWALFACWVLVLPTRVAQPPVGFFEGFVRYTCFLPPVLFAWTIAPLARELADSARARLAGGAIVATTAVYSYYAVRAAIADQYAPSWFAVAAADDPRLDRALLSWTTRAGSWVDAHAQPDDVIAFDGAFDTWVYPAYGATLRRRVSFLHPNGDAPVAIPDDVRWIAVDRSWSCVVGNPGFKDFGVWAEYIFKGEPTPDDLAVFRQLSKDSRFKLVYHEPRYNQAVFERVAR